MRKEESAKQFTELPPVLPMFGNQKEKIKMIRNLSRKKLKPLKKKR